MLDQRAHALALELEDPGGVAPAEHLVGLLVVDRDVVDVELDPLHPQVAQRVLDDRQVA